MITIKKEPKKLFEEFRVYEHCYFCQKSTNTWHIETNTPVCYICSIEKNISDIKKTKN